MRRLSNNLATALRQAFLRTALPDPVWKSRAPGSLASVWSTVAMIRPVAKANPFCERRRATCESTKFPHP